MKKIGEITTSMARAEKSSEMPMIECSRLQAPTDFLRYFQLLGTLNFQFL